MVRYKIGELQPQQEAFTSHNAHIQDQLRTSTMNSDACVSWWRIGGDGRLSVPNYLDAGELDPHFAWISLICSWAVVAYPNDQVGRLGRSLSCKR